MEGDDGRKKAVMEELVRGREFANQLRQVVFINNNNNGDEDDELATTTTRHHHLVNNVLNSFTNTLFLLLDNTSTKQQQQQQQQHPTNEFISQMQQRDDHFSFISSTSPAAKSDEEDSQESCKSTSPAGRGCYKRRKTTQTWEKVSEGPPTDDGHQWRKYGQKMILKSKYARNYYRCTHKVEQRCQATKQVQRIREKPPLYKTTYYGHHTCKYLLLQNPEDFILQLDDDHTSSSSPSSILLSFDNSTSSTFPPLTKQVHCPFLSSSSSSNFSEDRKKEVLPSSSSFDDHYLLSPDPTLDHSVTLQSEYLEDMMYGLFCSDSVERDDFFHPFLGF